MPVRHHKNKKQTHKIHLWAVIFVLLLLNLFVAYLFIRTRAVAVSKPKFKSTYSHGRIVGKASDRLILRIKSTATTIQRNTIYQKHSLSKKKSIGNTGFEVVTIPNGVDPTLYAQTIMQANPGTVVSVHTDDIISPDYAPNDQFYSNEWYLQTVHAPEAWDKANASNIIVGVCDTGFDMTHPDLAPNLLTDLAINIVDGTKNMAAIFPHGTSVAGEIGAVTNNGVGVSSITGGAKIIPVKISNRSDGAAYLSDIANCISYQADHGAKVINLSYRIAGYSETDIASQYAETKGAVVVVAGGNDGTNPGWPDYSSFIAVSATDEQENRAWFSNYGTYIDVAAPGVNLLTTYDGGSYTYFGGTSGAAPVVSGVAALVFAAKPTATPTEVKSILITTADDLGTPGRDQIYGYGRINAQRAVSAAIGNPISPTPTNTPLPPTSTPTPMPIGVPRPLVLNYIKARYNSSSSPCCSIQVNWEQIKEPDVQYINIYVNDSVAPFVRYQARDPSANLYIGGVVFPVYTPFTSYKVYARVQNTQGNLSPPSNELTAMMPNWRGDTPTVTPTPVISDTTCISYTLQAVWGEKVATPGAYWYTNGSANGQFAWPKGIETDQTGRIYIADTSNNRVQILNTNGIFISKWGTKGNSTGQFNRPNSLIIDTSGNVYVVDEDYPYNTYNRIQKFDANGNFIKQWGSYGSGDLQFMRPSGIAADKEGFVYVSDTGNNRIVKYTDNGQFVKKWGVFGSGPGQLNRPAGITIGTDGKLYVADSGNHRINTFDTSGNFAASWGTKCETGWQLQNGTCDNGFYYPIDLAQDAQGYFYVLESENNRVEKFTPDHKLITRFGSFGSLDGQFRSPSSITIDSSENIYVADFNIHRIQKFICTNRGTP